MTTETTKTAAAEDARLFAEELIAAHNNPEGVARDLREAAARCDQAAVRMSDGLRGADKKMVFGTWTADAERHRARAAAIESALAAE